MAPDANTQQIAPGEEAELQPIGAPYEGFHPGEHVGYSLNGMFFQGVQESDGSGYF